MGNARIYWEDFKTGETKEFGNYRVAKEEIIAFAKEYDPQPFHTDEEAAEHTMLSGLAASGFHSCAIMMKLICDAYILDAASLGSPGMDEVRWLQPVRPGDIIRIRRTCLESRLSKSRPGTGLCKFVWDAYNQNASHLMSTTGTQMFACRPAEAGE